MVRSGQTICEAIEIEKCPDCLNKTGDNQRLPHRWNPVTNCTNRTRQHANAIWTNHCSHASHAYKISKHPSNNSDHSVQHRKYPDRDHEVKLHICHRPTGLLPLQRPNWWWLLSNISRLEIISVGYSYVNLPTRIQLLYFSVGINVQHISQSLVTKTQLMKSMPVGNSILIKTMNNYVK